MAPTSDPILKNRRSGTNRDDVCKSLSSKLFDAEHVREIVDNMRWDHEGIKIRRLCIVNFIPYKRVARKRRLGVDKNIYLQDKIIFNFTYNFVIFSFSSNCIARYRNNRSPGSLLLARVVITIYL